MEFKNVDGYIEVYSNNRLIFSADNREEAEKELKAQINIKQRRDQTMITIPKHQVCYIANKNNQKSKIVFFMDKDRELTVGEEFILRDKHRLKLVAFDDVPLMARA